MSQLLSNLLLFGRMLRGLGMPVTTDRIRLLAEALEHVELGDREQFRDTARTVLVSRREDLEPFERAFALFWREGAPPPTLELGRMLRPVRNRRPRLALWSRQPPGESPETTVPLVDPRFGYSPREVLRRKDFGEMTPEELAAVRRLVRETRWSLGERRTRRRVLARRGETVELCRTVRRSLRYGGEPFELAWRRRRRRVRPLVLLCDVSGSMEPYARVMLHFLSAVTRGLRLTEAFLFGTRLTRVTRQLRERDVERAVRLAAGRVPDWAGGTRIGRAVREFNFEWGRRVLGRGAVVAVISDGWDRGEPDLLRREVARLRRSCHRLLWLNPLVGTAGYRPLTRGMRAALPYVDELLPVRNLASLEALAILLESIGDGRRLGRPPRRATGETRHA